MRDIPYTINRPYLLPYLITMNTTTLRRPPKLINKARFDKLTKHQKRVAISRDLLARVRRKLFKPNTGSVIQLLPYLFLQEMTGPAVQSKLNTEPCIGCAKGAILASWIGNFDSFNGEAMQGIDQCSINSGYPPELVEVFGERLMTALEAAFESERGGLYGWAVSHIADDEAKALFRYGDRYDDPKDRLVAIYENVVKNGGKLVVRVGNKRHTFN